ncbi:class I SAM-dependent methyltransferase [Neiella marina]|uniref:Class I SAM-dependent methyltransferase n=1 Tax=Neiella holothuriorum TaxID=2870530 RepID=A0ABS7EFX0_9GAMM|nr:class I SAM-dependent methyltransferase [Neiella holothuriorum]MBW8190823.1 class I SAM-dependent methyltransferase [Neiella holothuriorum]
MKLNQLNHYRCPKSLSPLTLDVTHQDNDEIIEGTLTSLAGLTFNITGGIPDFTYPKALAQIDEETRQTYDTLAKDYHKFADIPFRTFKTNEAGVREDIAQRLNIKPDAKVLEVGCGGGDGSVYLLKKLGPDGQLFIQDLSPNFLALAIDKIAELSSPATVEMATANACYLSFPDNHFDAAHHFGGLNTFSDIPRFLSELTRVVKPGGKIVIGDEGMAPWLRDCEFGKVMMNSNPLLKCSPPLDSLPTRAEQVKVEWIMMGAFYLVEFTVAQSEPVADYHIDIPSQRGGTHWSRYYGQLEGISYETKQLAYEAQKNSGMSMSDWLDSVVKQAATKTIRND